MSLCEFKKHLDKIDIDYDHYKPEEDDIKYHQDDFTRCAHIVLYPDNQDHRKLIEDLLESLEAKDNFPFRLFMIVHDSDSIIHKKFTEDMEFTPFECKKPHVHLVMYFNSKRKNYKVADFLGICSRYVYMSHDYKWCLTYLTHCEFAWNSKYHVYDFEEVACNNEDDLRDVMIWSKQFSQNGFGHNLVNYLYNTARDRVVERIDIIRWCNRHNVYKIASKSWNLIDQLRLEHNDKVVRARRLAVQNELNVIEKELFKHES